MTRAFANPTVVKLSSNRSRRVSHDRIVIAGFSQGGAMALHTGLRYPQRLAGVMVLSSYLPLRDSLALKAAAQSRRADSDVSRVARRVLPG